GVSPPLVTSVACVGEAVAPAVAPSVPPKCSVLTRRSARVPPAPADSASVLPSGCLSFFRVSPWSLFGRRVVLSPECHGRSWVRLPVPGCPSLLARWETDEAHAFECVLAALPPKSR